MTGHAANPVRPTDAAIRAVVVLSRDVGEASHARHWLRDVLDGAAARHHVDEACLVTSELVTNALRHGLGDVVVHASMAGDETVRVTVTDWSDEAPRVLPPDPARVGGVGLRIVQAIATAWGVAAFPGGKTVWASIGRPTAVAVDVRAVTSRD